MDGEPDIGGGTAFGGRLRAEGKGEGRRDVRASSKFSKESDEGVMG